jgi:SAM-dependent methyltransferase
VDHARYYRPLADDALTSARRILPIVFAVVRPDSVIDVGCGPGSWARAARSLGVDTVVGVDGSWAEPWADDSFAFYPSDLVDDIGVDDTFDLAICLEVAQYLPPERLPGFVSQLCDLAPHVLFSSRIPHQWDWMQSVGRWPSWWAEQFREHGRVPVDVVRPAVWSDAQIPAYYRQNMILYAPADAGGAQLPGNLDLVHPELWNAAHALTVRQRCTIAAGIPAAATRSVARRLGARAKRGGRRPAE